MRVRNENKLNIKRESRVFHESTENIKRVSFLKFF